MKKYLILLLAAILAFSVSGCGNKTDESLAENAEQEEKAVEDENKEQDENDVEDDTLVVENFTGQKLIENDGDIEVNFTISKIEMQERGLCIFYEISRNSSGYTALYIVDNIRLNGCNISEKAFYSGYNTEKEMGKNTSNYPDVPLIWVIPSKTLDNLGITEFDSLEFELIVGYTAYATAEYEYIKNIVLFKGNRHEIERYQLPYNEKNITLVENDKCKIVMVNAEWLGASLAEAYGQEYKLYFDVFGDERIEIKLDSITFGNGEAKIEAFGDFSRIRKNCFYVEAGDAGLQTVNWIDRDNDISGWDYTNAVFNLTVTYEDESGNTTEEAVSVPMNLNISFEE